jgi:hypothetical protein
MIGTKRHTVKINTAKIEWFPVHTGTKCYGFLNGILVFVIRPPSDSDKLLKPRPLVIHDLLHDHPLGCENIQDGEMIGQSIVKGLWGRTIVMPQLVFAQPTRQQATASAPGK